MKSKTSGYREHKPPMVKAKTSSTYKYKMPFGETLYSLSIKVFGEESSWYRLAQFNTAKDVFNFEINEEVTLPCDVYENTVL